MTRSEPAQAGARALSLLGDGEPIDAASFGLKAAWLDRALRAGEHVPPGLALTARFVSALVEGDALAEEQLERALQALRVRLTAPFTFAVRSSPNRSLPGALATELGVADDGGAILAALRAVHGSAERPHVAAQLATHGEESAPHEPWVAVLIQHELRFGGPTEFGAVALSHDPRSGEPGVRGEFASSGPSAVVSGRARPLSLGPAAAGMTPVAPRALAAIEALMARLVAQFGRPLELELGWVAEQLCLLQVRALTLSPRALVRVALQAIEDDSPAYAPLLAELAERGLDTFVEAHFDEQSLSASPPLLRGLPASPGAAVGVVVTDIGRALERAAHEPVILIRPDAVPEDVAAFRAARAVVTSSGGLTCHAAVIARGLSLPAVVGVPGVRVDAARGLVYGGRDTREVILKEGDWVSLDARRGGLYRGRHSLVPELRDAELRRLFVEARKLRPTPLWVAGEASEALRLKDDACLDGALCPWPALGALPLGSGRECWVEVPVQELEARLAQLPRGWGVVITGDLQEVRLAELRAHAPLRAFGARLTRPDAVLPEGSLDLLVIDFGDELPLEKRACAPRLLKLMNFPERAPVPSGNNVGWVCPASHASRTALRYAAVRANREAISLAELGEP